MENETLISYIEGQVRAGAKKADIQEALLAVGWSEDDVSMAYARALVVSGVPVPEGDGKSLAMRKASTADVMIGFFAFILLGIILSAIGSLFFEIIDKYFPDRLVNGALGSAVSSDTVHYSTAALIVGMPLYLFALRLWFRRFREDDARAESRLTKWVTYLVLLVAAITIVGDFIAVLFTFLQGEISARFFLKALVILGISGMVFGFYFLERRKVQYKKDVPRKTFQSFGWGLVGVATLGIVLGFLAVGSPATERMRTFDVRRASNLVTLAGCISGYAREFSRLPGTLSDLDRSSQFGYCLSLRDPETEAPYEYRPIKDFLSLQDGSEAEFELCAVFALDSSENIQLQSGGGMYSSQPSSKWNSHSAGRNCKSETVVLKKNTVYPAPLPSDEVPY